MEIKAKINKGDLIKLTSFCTEKKTIKQKDNLYTVRKYLQMMQPTTATFPKYTDSSFNSTATMTIKTTKIQLKNRQKT